jgi:site-specific recombinase XerD
MRDERQGLTPDGLYWLSKRPGSEQWQRTWFDTGARQTRRASLGTSEVQEAHERLIEWWVANRRLSNERPESVTLSEILTRYYDEHASDKASSTQAEIACAKLTAFSGALPISEFNIAEQRRFIAQMKSDGYSAGYIRRTLSVGKAALTWAWANELVKIVPNVVLPQDGAPRERTLSIEEIGALFNAVDETHVYRFLVLLCATWARPDAILDLDGERCDHERKLITLNPPGRQQTKKYRPVLPMVERAEHVCEVKSGPVIAWRGKPLASIKTAWRRLRSRAGLDDGVIPYLVRHTMATEARAAGAPPWEIEGWLGHKRPGTSERYAKFAPDYLGATARVVNDYIAKLPFA